MPDLPAIECPRCHATIVDSDPNCDSAHATDYTSCRRKCERCGLGFSNARKLEAITVIYREPFASVPQDICNGMDDVIASSLNVISRTKKRSRLASSNSEDHATWVVFRYLQLAGQLRAALGRAGVSFARNAVEEPNVLFWGCPVPAANTRGQVLREKLESISEGLGEMARRRSEPDVILEFGGAGVVFVEVKLRSKNDDTSADYPNWSKYVSSTDAFSSASELRQSRHYELARNWRLAWSLAGDGAMSLVNLGPADLFTEPENRRRLDQFTSALNQTERRDFIETTWTELLGQLEDYPKWLLDYLDERRILATRFTGYVKGRADGTGIRVS